MDSFSEKDQDKMLKDFEKEMKQNKKKDDTEEVRVLNEEEKGKLGV